MKKRILPLCLLPALLCSCGGGGTSSSSSPLPSSSVGPSAEWDYVAPTTDARTYDSPLMTDACYEIMVYSFADSNGDGIGDLKGVEDHLDYLQELGVKNLWLTPIHPSDTYHKYNVEDYYDIDPSFGTMADFESLVAKAKAKGIGIIMDMVFNHSGIRNPWVEQCARDKLAGKEGADSFADVYVMDEDSTKVPNKIDRITVDGHTFYYECNFDKTMPEFNLTSEKARALHADIMSFWIDKGVAGFRFDATKFLDYKSEKRSLEYVNYLAGAARAKKSNVYLVAEQWIDTQVSLNKIAANGMSGFNFPTSDTVTNSILYAIMGSRGHNFAKTLALAEDGFLEKSGGTILPSFFISNHDQDRWPQVFEGNMDKIRQAAMMYILTPGTPFVYYGEEIAMYGTRPGVSGTDASRRLPMQWYSNASKDTYRTTAILKENDYKGIQTSLGALDAIKDPNSLTSWYKSLLHFRADHPEIQKGYYWCLTNQEKAPFSAFKITYEGKDYYLVHNVSGVQHTFGLPKGLTLNSFHLGTASYADGVLTLGPNSGAFLEA